jgi:hypothetical protein
MLTTAVEQMPAHTMRIKRRDSPDCAVARRIGEEHRERSRGTHFWKRKKPLAYLCDSARSTKECSVEWRVRCQNVGIIIRRIEMLDRAPDIKGCGTPADVVEFPKTRRDGAAIELFALNKKSDRS